MNLITHLPHLTLTNQLNLRFKRGKNRKSINAFTLIELLVVIGILGILAILVVQTYSDAKSTSVDAQVRASLTSLNQASYRANIVGDGGRPDITWTNVSPTPNNPGAAVQWYIDNGYLSLAEFDPTILNYIEIGAGSDGPNIWKRKP